MKKFRLMLVVSVMALGLAACAKSKVIDGVKYEPYGIFNEEQHRNPNIEYEIVFGNIVWSIILIETIIAPVYFIGFAIKQPVGKKLPESERH